MTPETLIVHYADDLDAKYHMMYAALRDDTHPGAITSKNASRLRAENVQGEEMMLINKNTCRWLFQRIMLALTTLAVLGVSAGLLFSDGHPVAPEHGEFGASVVADRATHPGKPPSRNDPIEFTGKQLETARRYRQERKYDKAILVLNKLIETNPNFVEAYITRGGAYIHLGNLDKAVADYKRVLLLNPHGASAHLGFGMVCMMQNNPKSAIEHLTRAIRFEPEDPVAHYTRGGAYFMLEEFDSALADINEALRLNSSYAAAYYMRAAIFAKAGFATASLCDINTAIRLDPTSAGPYAHRARLHDMLGNTNRAQADRKRAIELDPAYRNMEECRKIKLILKEDVDPPGGTQTKQMEKVE